MKLPGRMLLFLACALFACGPAAAAQKASYKHYLKALLLTNQGNLAEALKEYEAALHLDPQSSTIYEEAAELALEMGRTEKALELAARFVELSPGSAKARYLLGNVYWARGELSAAQASLEKTLELKPDYSEALYALGNMLSGQSPESAKKYLEDYLSRNPDNASDAEFQIAVIEQRAGREESAVGHLRSALELDSDNMHAYYALAQIYEVRRDTEAALAVYEEILSRDPGNAALLNHVGEIHYLLGDAERALERFAAAKEAAPSNPTACMWMALLAEERGDFAAAAASIAESSALGEEAGLSLRLGYYLTQDNRLKEAVGVLEKAHSLWPRNEDISYFLALGYDDIKEPGKAIELMKEVLALRPDHRDAMFQLGALYEKKGDMANTEIQFREILRLHPEDASAMNFLGYALADRGQKLDEAEALIQKAVAIDSDNGAFVDSLGWVRHKKGDLDGARAQLEKAVRLLPSDETVWAHLAEVRQAQGHFGEAWLAWKTAQLNRPGKAQYAKGASRLESRLTGEDLGGLYSSFLSRNHGRPSSYGGACAIDGEAAGKKFSYNGILHFRAPWDLRIDVLGPMFVPVFGAGLRGRDGFAMDPLEIEGVDGEALREFLFRAFRVMRDYLQGGYFRGEGAAFKSGWRRARLEAQGFEVELDKPRLLPAAVRSLEAEGMELVLEGYGVFEGGRRLPTIFRLRGRGFSIVFKLTEARADFAESAGAQPASEAQ